MDVTLLQRVVPHYRVPIFERLHAELGWTVATGRGDAGFGLLGMAVDPPWLYRFDFRRSPRNEYSALVPLGDIRRLLRPDAVVAEFSLQMSSTWSLAARRGLGLRPKLAFWSQGWNHERGFARASDRVSQHLRLAIMRRADAHLTYTDDGANYLRRSLGVPVFVARNTLDSSTMPGTNIDRSPSDPSHARLLAIGRLTDDKRIDHIVNALAILRRNMPGVTLTIVGDGPARAQIERAAAPLGNAVTMTGAIYDPARTAAILQEATCVVIGGSAGLSVNHALAYGVPVVLADDPAIHHHPEHAYVVEGVTGWRAPSGSAAAMASTLQRALSGTYSPKIALREKLRNYVAVELSVTRMLSGFHDLHRYLETGIGNADC